MRIILAHLSKYSEEIFLDVLRIKYILVTLIPHFIIYFYYVNMFSTVNLSKFCTPFKGKVSWSLLALGVFGRGWGGCLRLTIILL